MDSPLFLAILLFKNRSPFPQVVFGSFLDTVGSLERMEKEVTPRLLGLMWCIVSRGCRRLAFLGPWAAEQLSWG